MTIKHLVVSGGGPSLLQTLGSLQYLEKYHYVNINEIETIYGTSAGGIIGVLLCLKYDWETLNDYLIQRPWNEVFSVRIDNIFEAYKKKGIFDIKHLQKVFKPLFDAKDISMEITLHDFFKMSNIELHFFSYEINQNTIEDISYLNFPNLPVLTAIHMTCSLPLVFTPVCLNDKCYIDGGFISNYPLKYCIESGKNKDEILGFKNDHSKSEESNSVDSSSTLLTFLMSLLFKIVRMLNVPEQMYSINNEILTDAKFVSISYLTEAFNSVELRKNLLNSGIETAKIFLDNHTSNKNSDNK